MCFSNNNKQIVNILYKCTDSCIGRVIIGLFLKYIYSVVACLIPNCVHSNTRILLAQHRHINNTYLYWVCTPILLFTLLHYCYRSSIRIPSLLPKDVCSLLFYCCVAFINGCALLTTLSHLGQILNRYYPNIFISFAFIHVSTCCSDTLQLIVKPFTVYKFFYPLSHF